MNTIKTHNKNIYPLNFPEIFSTYYKPLCLFVFALVKRMPLAEDIVVDAFCKLWEKRNEIRHEQAIYSWLCTTSRNKALNLIKASKQVENNKEKILQELTTGHEDDQLERMMHAELVAELHRLIHELPPQCSKVLASLYIQDKSVAETASELELSVNTIKSHKARGIDLLRHKLRPLLLALLLSVFLQ